MSAYEKFKAWLALGLGIYLILQCVGLVVGGTLFTFVGGEGVGILMLLLGFGIIYVGYRLAKWGWKRI